MSFLELVFIVALLAAFALVLLTKWGAIEWVQVHGNDFFSEMFRCNFCLSFWAGAVVSLLACMFTGDARFLAVPFCSTMITRFLL